MVIKVPLNYLRWKLMDRGGHLLEFRENYTWLQSYDEYLRARRVRSLTVNGQFIVVSEENDHKVADLYHDEIWRGQEVPSIIK
jgi:hypothetical protein